MGWVLGLGNGVVFRQGGGSGLGSSYWLTRTPTTLALTNIGYPEGIQLNWLNAGADYHGTSIERSADGVTYAEIDTVASGVLTYQDTTAVFGSTYYYRVRCYKGTNYSPYSNAESLEVTSDRFIITVDTTKAGSANDTFVLPLPSAGTYDYYVDWGEGGAEEHFVVNTSQTHVYASSGTYQIRIRGTFPHMIFNGAGDYLKVMSLDNWGTIAWGSLSGMFTKCSNLIYNAKDIPNFTGVSLFTTMFYQCTNVYGFNFNGWDTSNGTSFYCTFRELPLLKCSFAPLSIKSATNIQGIAQGNNINDPGTTTNYDATLISWSAQAVLYSKTALNTNFGTSKYGEGLVDSGTTDGVSANKLVDSTQNFLTTVTVGDVVYNTTDGTYAFVTAIDSDTQLSISADIMASGEVYRIQHSDAAKARAQLVIPVVDGGQGWTLTDGGYFV